MNYKPSKYNYCHECEDGSLLLYNSAKGTESFVKVENNKKDIVLEALKNGTDRKDETMSALHNRGYLVCAQDDETSLIKYRVMEQVMDSALHLIILPTEQCNFRCKYCYETFAKGRMSEEVQNSLIRYVRKNISKYTALYVSWFGGEPLIALDIVEHLSKEFLKICKASRRVYAASMTTNGYNLTLENYKKLYELGVYNYQITIDGTQEEHDAQRVLADGTGTFFKIAENLRNIKNQTKYLNSSFIIRTNFSKKILSNIDKFLEFYQDSFGGDSRFNFYIHMASDWGGERVEEFCDEMISRDQYEDILKAIIEAQAKISFNSHYSHMNYRGCVCYASKKNSVIVGSDATLYKCTGDFEFEKNKVGILTEDGKLEYNENIKLWLGGLSEADKKCKKCYYEACCLSNNCPAVRVKGLTYDGCSFEMEHMGLFLELLNEEFFYVIR